MDTVNTTHTTAETEVTERTTATTAADTTSMKQTMNTILTITARMVTETTTAKASTPAPALKTIMMAAADTRAMKTNIDVGTANTMETIARMSMADTTTITSEQIPADMKQTTPPQMMTPALPPVKVAGDIVKKMKCVA